MSNPATSLFNGGEHFTHTFIAWPCSVSFTSWLCITLPWLAIWGSTNRREIMWFNNTYHILWYVMYTIHHQLYHWSYIPSVICITLYHTVTYHTISYVIDMILYHILHHITTRIYSITSTLSPYHIIVSYRLSRDRVFFRWRPFLYERFVRRSADCLRLSSSSPEHRNSFQIIQISVPAPWYVHTFRQRSPSKMGRNENNGIACVSHWIRGCSDAAEADPGHHQLLSQVRLVWALSESLTLNC